MAHIKEYRDKDGTLKSFYIRVFRGKGIKPYSTTFKVDPSWSYKKAKKEAEKYATVYEEECKRGKICDSAYTLGEYLHYVIDLKFERGAIKKRTYSRWLHDSKRIDECIGHIKLKDLKVSDLNNFYSSLSLAPKSIYEIHRLISMVLTHAVKEEILLYNIATRAEPPKLKKVEVDYYQREEVIHILECADKEDLRHKTLIYLFVYTGARRGEVAGLKWEDIDFDRGTIHIRRSILYAPEYGVFEDTPKSKKSVRRITLSEDVIYLLNCLRTEAPESQYVFQSIKGKPLHPDSISTYLTRFSKKYDLPHIHSHSFRHTMASMLYSEGVDPVSISARLGHSRVSTTADLYSHVIEGYDQKSAEILTKVYKKD